VADSPMNVYLRALKLLLFDAESELDEQQFHTLRAILIIALTAHDEEEVA
jgi:hypothetical protein